MNITVQSMVLSTRTGALDARLPRPGRG